MSKSTSKRPYHTLSDEEMLQIMYSWEFVGRPEQQFPTEPFDTWLILAGRGFGKTRTGAEWVLEKAKTPNTRIALVARTFRDVEKVMVLGESGIVNCSPPWNKPTYVKGSGLSWPNGSKAELFTAEEPDLLRGPQFHYAWADELASWNRIETYDMLNFCLRLGKHPQTIITTTPRPIPVIRDDLLKDPHTFVTRGSTFDNAANLPDKFLNSVRAKYEGTKLGRQELYAEVLDITEGALWSHDLIDKNRFKDQNMKIEDILQRCTKIVVAIDPAVTNKEDSDLTGIVVAGKTESGQGVIIADHSMKGSPHEWASEAVRCYTKYQADIIVAENNQGGDMVEHTIKTIDYHVPYKGVRASRGKRTRAEPISSLYEEGRISHYGTLPELEDEMTQWVPDVSPKSPDRLDAMVWAMTELMVGGAVSPFILNL